MSSKEIQEGNAVIAIFDGWESYIIKDGLSKGMTAYFNEKRNFHRYPIEAMKYHTSFDWLMPVCKKFVEMNEKDFNPDDDFEISITYQDHRTYIHTTALRYEITPLFEAVVKALTWYNSLTPSKKEG